MNRYRIVVAACMLLVFAALGEGGTPVSIVNSKHNLSSSGSGSIKSLPPGSGGTSEICVFCHTPHTARLEAPLWNRTNPAGPYTVYYSDVMSALSITPESPVQAGGGYAVHVKTRICMSCHDGTIALGQLVNMPAGMTGSVAMQGTTGGMMPSSTSGYIGTDLRDDHPVAVKHRDPAAVNPEMKTLSGSLARLYYDAGGGVIRSNQSDGGWIECTSCHDVHDNQYGNFLVDDNVGSKLCLSCHNKTGYTSILANESVHSNTTYSNAYPTATGGTPATLGSSVQNVKCMVCHFPHKSGVLTTDMNTPRPGSGKYLLTFKEEQSCYNTPNRWGQANTSCHDTGGAGKNIKAEVTKGSAHHVGSYTGSHNATEGRGGAGWSSQVGSGWHVECDDCHNSHAAGNGVRTKGTNIVTRKSPLYGAGGVQPGWPAAWNSPNTFTYTEPLGLTTNVSTTISYEYEICLRCHSTFAWATPPAGLHDQGKEFNTNNPSYHSVVQVNPASYASTSWNPAGGFNNSSTMFCSDCHGNDAGSPVGPHGSSVSGLLIKSYGRAFTAKGTNQSTTDLCFNCHDATAYQTGTQTAPGTGFWTTGNINLHTRHLILSGSSTTSTFGYVCVNCHTLNAHGYQRKGLIVVATDPEAGTYSPPGGSKITGVGAGLPASRNYSPTKTVDCSTVNGCHQ